MVTMAWNILLASSGQLSWPCSLPASCAGRAWETGKSLIYSKHYLATTKILICYQHYSHINPKYNTKPAIMKNINSKVLKGFSFRGPILCFMNILQDVNCTKKEHLFMHLGFLIVHLSFSLINLYLKC